MWVKIKISQRVRPFLATFSFNHFKLKQNVTFEEKQTHKIATMVREIYNIFYKEFFASSVRNEKIAIVATMYV